MHGAPLAGMENGNFSGAGKMPRRHKWISREGLIWRKVFPPAAGDGEGAEIVLETGVSEMSLKPIALGAALALAAAAPALAQSAGDWTGSIGLGAVMPKSTNAHVAGDALSVDNDTQITLGLGYFFTDNIALDVLAATPFSHDISLGGAKIGTTKHLPPTISLQYHFKNDSKFTPFVGAGLNYTTFFSTKSSLGELKLKDSVGLALQAGVDMKLSDKGSLRADLRWINIETDMRLDGAKIGTAKLNPMVAGVSYVHRF